VSGVAGALLAAGSSSRLGRPKAFLELDGRTLLRRAAEELAAVVAPLLVVVPPQSEPFVRELAGLDVELVINRDPTRGVGSSIAVAARALRRSAPEAGGLLLLHVDQPRVDRALLARLVGAAGEALERSAACRASDGTIGPPSLFRRELLADLAELSGDRGARTLLERERDQAPSRLVTVLAPEAFVDIDTAADYARLIGSGNP
jgi:CTP:molybdopterin cytidylyltransferase MocA